MSVRASSASHSGHFCEYHIDIGVRPEVWCRRDESSQAAIQKRRSSADVASRNLTAPGFLNSSVVTIRTP